MNSCDQSLYQNTPAGMGTGTYHVQMDYWVDAISSGGTLELDLMVDGNVIWTLPIPGGAPFHSEGNAVGGNYVKAMSGGIEVRVRLHGSFNARTWVAIDNVSLKLV